MITHLLEGERTACGIGGIVSPERSQVATTTNRDRVTCKRCDAVLERRPRNEAEACAVAQELCVILFVAGRTVESRARARKFIRARDMVAVAEFGRRGDPDPWSSLRRSLAHRRSGPMTVVIVPPTGEPLPLTSFAS